MYSIFINFKKLKTNKDQLIKFLLKNKVRVQFHFTPIVNFKHFKKPIRNYPNALLYSSSVISLPIFVELTIFEQKKILKLIKSFINKYLK